jgi:hypothetical protein
MSKGAGPRTFQARKKIVVRRLTVNIKSTCLETVWYELVIMNQSVVTSAAHRSMKSGVSRNCNVTGTLVYFV